MPGGNLWLLIVVPLEVSKQNPVFLSKHVRRRFWGVCCPEKLLSMETCLHLWSIFLAHGQSTDFLMPFKEAGAGPALWGVFLFLHSSLHVWCPLPAIERDLLPTWQ